MSIIEVLDQAHMAAGEIRRPAVFLTREAAGGRGAIYDQAEQFRRRLLAGEIQVTQAVIDRWRDIQTQLRAAIEPLVKFMLAVDVEMTVAQGRALERLSSIDNQIHRLLGEYAARVEGDLAGILLDVGTLGADQADTLVGLQIPPQAAAAGYVFDRLPREAVEQMVAQTVEGPLRDLLGRLAPDLVDDLAGTLVDGIGLGLSPRETARRLGNLADVPRWRSLNIARTETMRAYREANRRSLTRNRRIIEGWRWSASLDDRTCPVCWAMHGTLFAVEATFGSHPSCRCAPVPVTKSWADLGIEVDDAPVLQMDDGPDLFARQPVTVQRSVLGPGKYQAWKDGRFELGDLVGERFDATWGDVRFEKPLRSLIAKR